MATRPRSARPAAVIVAVCVSATALFAQTAVKLPKNKYTPEQDVKLGREAAAEVLRQYPVIKDQKIATYLTSLGDRLVAAAPSELKLIAWLPPGAMLASVSVSVAPLLARVMVS